MHTRTCTHLFRDLHTCLYRTKKKKVYIFAFIPLSSYKAQKNSNWKGKVSVDMSDKMTFNQGFSLFLMAHTETFWRAGGIFGSVICDIYAMSLFI